ncbi:MAG TPA: phosphoglucosamine mutase [Planctomycetota bacterium]|nr:phosphoglucosamine mutase [Planctomycetota bacterium]
MTASRPVVRFGTDGLRGRWGQPPLDADTLRRVAAAFGVSLQRAGSEHKRVLLGHDGRRSAPAILQAMVDGLTAADVACTDAGLLTTPALANLVRDEGFAGGVMVSASHNPASDNGVKLFDATGGKIADEVEREIEELAVRIDAEDRVARGRARPRHELVQRYEDRLRNVFPDLDLTGLKIAVDASNGGGSEIAPRLLRLFGAEVVATACTPDGDNINAGVGALHPEVLAGVVRAEGAMFGVCLDGDGDRGVFVDETGAVHDGDAVLAALAPWLDRTGALPHRTVVATVMSNLGLRRALARHDIALVTTPVGDRHVVQAMRAGGYGLGGEQSGHIVFAGPGRHTGDGLFTALMLLAMRQAEGKGFAELFAGFTRYPQALVNVAVRSKPPLGDLPAVQRAVQEVESALGDDGRVLVRYSGTEDVCRVMVEGPREDDVRRHAEHIAAALRASL